MKKSNIINLVKYYVEKNDSAFRNEVLEIANDFYNKGDVEICSYLMDLISTTNYYQPQNNYRDLIYLTKHTNTNKPLYLPEVIKDDILGIIRSTNKNISITKILFYGKPGTGKTESAFQIARLMNRDILTVKMEDLIDSHLGQTSKNIITLFDEIRHLYSNNIVVLFDEIDALVMNRVNNNDLREMGRVTSTFLKELDNLSDNIILIATTNLVEYIDSALLRRFDAKISFDRYSEEDLIEVSECILKDLLRKSSSSKADSRLFRKILTTVEKIPYPGDMLQIIKIALAFSDDSNQYDYLRRLYIELNKNADISIQKLTSQGFTTREIEILTGIPKSSVARKLKDDIDE